MKKRSSVSINYLLNTGYQILTLLTPLITTPYISRVLSPDKIGLFSYASAVTTYFVIFASIGTSIYARRKIAFLQDKKNEQSSFFGEIFLLRFILFSIAEVIYAIFVYIVTGNSLLFWVQGINLVSDKYNIDWVYTGNEEFKYTIGRSTAIKLASIVAIFLFVKNPDDLVVYALILACSSLIGNLVMWLNIKRYISFNEVVWKIRLSHLSGSIKMFMPQIAGSVYLYFDKVMLKLLTTSTVENGYYEQAQKIVRLSLTIITSLPTVLLPRMANACEKNEEGKVKEYLNQSIVFLLFLGIPMTLGLMAIASMIVPWFFGMDYLPVISLLIVLAPILLFNGLYNMIGCQYLLAKKEENVLTITILCGSVINIILNYLLIGKYGAVGASIGSLIAELIVAGIQLIYVRHIIDLQTIWKSTYGYLISGVVMFIILLYIKKYLEATFINTLLMIACGGVIYLCGVWILKDPFVRKISKMVNRKK